MQVARVRCPHCSMILDIPESYTGSKIRCGNCQNGFGLPSFSDKDILDTIVDPERVGPPKVVPVPVESELDKEIASMLPPEMLEKSPPQNSEDVLTEEGEIDESPEKPVYVATENDHLPTGFSVSDINRLGVWFEFPANLLNDENFRGKMPKSCVRCGATSFLNTHLIIYAHDLLDVISTQNDHVAKRIELKDRDIKRMSPADLLAALPKLDKLTSPLNMPMPFWVCDLCDPSRLIYARGDVNEKTGEGNCRLRIKRLKSAEEFLCNIGGRDTEPHKNILEKLAAHKETAWDQLPDTVQQRLLKWYNALNKEKFVVYIPDRTYSKSEDGTAGIIVTSRRLLFRSARRFHELQKGESLKLSFAMSGKELHLNILGPNWEVKKMLTDKASLMKLRRSLTKQNFEATWE